MIAEIPALVLFAILALSAKGGKWSFEKVF